MSRHATAISVTAEERTELERRIHARAGANRAPCARRLSCAPRRATRTKTLPPPWASRSIPPNTGGTALPSTVWGRFGGSAASAASAPLRPGDSGQDRPASLSETVRSGLGRPDPLVHCRSGDIHRRASRIEPGCPQEEHDWQHPPGAQGAPGPSLTPG